MPTYRHGKGSRIILSSVDASSLLNEMTISHSVDTGEITVFTDTDKEFIAGHRTGTFSAGGFLDVSTAGTNDPYKILRSALGSTAPLILTAIPGGPGGSTITPGSLARLGNARPTGFETAAPALGVVTAKFDATIDGRFDVGRTLYGPGAPKTSTFSGTSIDSGVAAGTTGGGVAHFHITAASTITAGVTVKVQHSSLGASWSDIASYTSTSTGSQRVLASTSVIKRYTRATISSMTGGASKSVSIVVAFARRGAVR